ncbi:MAG: helix-turn-helix transcriptional regulator [Clostridia bacterium]|nr:helix-turn-helix transcriptional regulator [Clostridia bacterium]
MNGKPDKKRIMLFSSDPLTLATGHFEPGNAEAFCRAVENEDRRRLAEAELAYIRGESAQANEAFRALAETVSEDLMPTAILGSVLSSLAGGDLRDLIQTYEFARSIQVSSLDGESELTRLGGAFMLYFNILIRNLPAITFPPFGPDAFSMPPSLVPLAFYIYTSFLIETGDVGRAIGMAEGALVFMDRPCPVSEIYLSLIIARGYMLQKVWDKAEFYFKYAWNLAKPDRLYMPFAEHRGMLSGMLEKCLRYDEPQAYKKILELSNAYHKRWVFVHNELTGERISDALTAIEYNVASLAAKGLSNGEIADFLGITVNSVRAHLRNIFNKLGIGNRRALGDYVI